MIVAIPSKGRAGKVPSQKIIPSAQVFVPDLEVDAYRAAGTRNVRAVPDDVLGITRTRNWILDNVDDPWVVFVDDDAKRVGWWHLLDTRGEFLPLSESEWLAVWFRLFELAYDLDYRVWGTSTDGDKKSVYTYRPLIFHTYLTASCCGIRNETGIRFDESFPVKEDYEIGLRCIKEDGGIVGARFICWGNSHWQDAGGCREYRTQQMEEDAIRRLMRMYPGLIRRVTRGGSDYSIEIDF